MSVRNLLIKTAYNRIEELMKEVVLSCLKVQSDAEIQAGNGGGKKLNEHIIFSLQSIESACNEIQELIEFIRKVNTSSFQ